VSDHHPYGPSSLARVVACPGSVVLSAGMADIPTDYADEGHELHAIVAGLALPPVDLSAEHAELVQACRDELSRYDAPAGILHEQRLSLLDIDFNEVSFGTADVLIPRADDLVLVDWKFGRGTIEPAESNWQMQAYAAMALQASGKARCQVVLYQPRLRRRTDAVYGRDIITGVQDAIHVAKYQNEKSLYLCYGEHCKYCRAKPTCMEYQRKVMPVVGQSTQAVTDPVTIADWLEKASAVVKWAENVKHRARQMMIEEKVEVPGWGLANKQGKRQIADAQAAYQRLVATIGHEAFMEAVKLDIATLEDTYARKRKAEAGVTLVAAKRELAEVLDGIMERSGDTLELRRKSNKE
jgi:hypothetical protein